MSTVTVMLHGPAKHVLSDVDPVARTATCRECGPVSIRSKGSWWTCRIAANERKRYAGERERNRHRKRPGTRVGPRVPPHRKHVKDTCERCGLQDDDVRLFDVHHIDGDHENNDVANLRTLCPNCHRREHRGM